MCGIAGILGGRDAEALVRRMATAIAHRGPDDEGIERLTTTQGDVTGAFGHRRLAIIDLSPAGHQPMRSADRRWTIVFNGEIYNYRQMAAALRAEGVSFHGASDTEVLLEGFARHGPAYLEQLRGMYAFALWDAEQRVMYLARDAFGIKPMYLAQADGQLAFASEVRALLAAGIVERRIAAASVRAYLEWGSVPEPMAMIDGVTPLAAGACVRVRYAGGSAMEPEVVSRVSPFATGEHWPVRDRKAAVALVGSALRDSVRHHLVADVPVALFLSGGIDSSAVVALAAQESPRPLETFTITFGESRFDETGPARVVARRFGTHHREIPLTGDDLFAELPAAFAAMDQPSMDGLNTYAVSKAVRDHGLKVVLSGLGGDELFAGYPSFRRAGQISALWPATTPFRRAGALLAARGGLRGEKLALMMRARHPALAAYHGSRALFAGALLDALTAGPEAPAYVRVIPKGLSLLGAVSWLEATGYMRDTLLRDSDVFSMAHALELRVPFVDRHVAAAAMAVPDEYKLVRGRSKPLIVDALGDLLPRQVWDRPKQGFVLPFENWMRGPLRNEVAEALTSPMRLARVGVDGVAARHVWDAFLAGRRGMTWSRPWALYTLVRWAEQIDAEVELPDEPPPVSLAAGGAGALAS